MAKAAGSTSPMMRQYQQIRRGLPDDVLLFYRLGDFYELFFEDAKEASGLLNVALTKRNEVPMCGVPHHSAESYIAKLVKAGKRVAIAEQTSAPQAGKIVDRAIAQIVSAGTIDDLNLLDAKRHNYLAAVYEGPAGRKSAGGALGLACLDHTTGEFRVTECADREALEDELSRIAPSELLYSEEQAESFAALRHALPCDGYAFLHEQAFYALKAHFKVQSLDGFGCAQMPAAIGAAGAILHYLEHQLRRSTAHVRKLTVYSADEFVVIDRATQQNLDLVDQRSGQAVAAKSGATVTLVSALDRTSTPMGARLLRHWILHPLREVARLKARQDLIETLLAQPFVLSELRESLKVVRDIERTLSRLSQGSGNARDLQALSTSLEAVPGIKSHLAALGLEGAPSSLAAELQARLHGFDALVAVLEKALVDEPPVAVKEGGIFCDGYSAALDEMRTASTEGKQWIADLQSSEAARTGIKSLKIKYNSVFGYFIEVTKSNLGLVPEDYQRKQTTANAERFYTAELKEVENKILGADERARKLEYEEFLNLRETALEHLLEIQETAGALATLDVLCGLAETARLFGYTRPVLNETRTLYISEGRHPVLDQNIAEEKFVPNDTSIEPEKNRLLLITGPNMAGKSTYIRQVALLTLMAQIGSYLPAASAEIGVVDRIFTRVGASDDISRGQSTFMVEMNETALIVNNATERSLVILDEIGRGTATFDGLSIAWSVAEYLHDVIGARGLFATHYHELTALSKTRPAVRNYNIAVREWNDQIIFLRKIVEGSADKSYGIQVARLAGLPDEIIARSKEILRHLEANASRPDQEAGAQPATEKAAPSSRVTVPKPAAGKKKKEGGDDLPQSDSPQLSLFS